MRNSIWYLLGMIGLLIVFSACSKGGNGVSETIVNRYYVIDHSRRDLSMIQQADIDAARAKLHIVYQHTSHGSQLITGMNSMATYPEFGSTYAWSGTGEAGTLDLVDCGIPACADLSQGDSVDENGDTPWVVATRALLDDSDNKHINVVVWSWCSINGHDAQRYVDNMEKLIAEYPSVAFVFMTGHAEGQSEDMTKDGVRYNNELIRNHCKSHDRILFDFADIESYDPDGTYYLDQAMYDNLDYSGGNWAEDWIAAHPDHQLSKLTMGSGSYAGCSGCAHSDDPDQANLNCILKAQAAWRLWIYLANSVF